MRGIYRDTVNGLVLEKSFASVIGHEFGHDILGLRDATSKTDPIGPNVKIIENAVRKELNMPAIRRYSYDYGKILTDKLSEGKQK